MSTKSELRTKLSKPKSVLTKILDLRPHPKLFGIYHCYAKIISATKATPPSSQEISVLKDSEKENTYFALNNFTLLYRSLSPDLKIKMNIINEEDINWVNLKYHLSKELFELIKQLKINIDRINPTHLLQIFNTHLSQPAIYDLNVRIYEKPHIQLSFHTLATLLSCSRNQLNYQQNQIERAYRTKCAGLTQKCFALSLQNFNTKVFWEI